MTDPVCPVAPREPVGTIAKLIEEGESDHAGLCTQFDGCWHCRVLDSLRDLEKRTDGYPMPAVVTSPTDGSNDAIRRAALDTASRIGMFAATWPEFYAFGLAVKASLAAAPVPCAASPADMLGTAIVDVAKRLGITKATTPMTGPEVMLLLQEIEWMARAIGEGRDAVTGVPPVPVPPVAAVEELAAVAVSLDPHRLQGLVDRYAAAARVISLHLREFCNDYLPYDEMIAQAARRVAEELESNRAELARLRGVGHRPSGGVDDPLTTASIRGLASIRRLARWALRKMRTRMVSSLWADVALRAVRMAGRSAVARNRRRVEGAPACMD